MTPCTLLRETAKRFRTAGIPDPENDSALILSFLCGAAPLSLRLDTDTVLSDGILSAYAALAERRLAREPLQYITGEAPFFGRMFSVDRRVLIPRPETEELCAWALEMLPVSGADVLDLCCGSGCIGLSLKAAYPDAVITLSDLSADALAVSAENSRRLNLEVGLHQGDLLEGFTHSSFDLIVCNPPYIPSVDCEVLQPEVLFEPRMALDGGSDGLDFYRRLVVSAASVLAPDGSLLMELGIHESEAVSALLSASGYHHIEIRKDLADIDRMILGKRPDGEKQ